MIGLFFGGFQALMPFVGWLLGSQFEKYITSIDHWIAFILLGKIAIFFHRFLFVSDIFRDISAVILYCMRHFCSDFQFPSCFF